MATDIAVVYDVTEAGIAALRDRYAELKADTPQGYEAVRLAIADVRTTRVAVEARRKELKAHSLEYGRRVDAVAKHLIEQLEVIEHPLKLLKAAVDEEKARAKASEEEAKLRAWQEQLRAENEAELERQRKAREQEEARLQAEQERLAADRASLEAQRADQERVLAEAAAAQRAAAERVAAEQAAAQQRISEERRAMEAERAGIEAARREGERKERERLAAIAAREQAECERVAAEEARAAELLQLEAMRPDIEKIRAFAQQLRDLAAAAPGMTTPVTQLALAGVCHQLRELAKSLDTLLVCNPETPDALDDEIDF